jgi:hypothetical protein
MVVPLASWAITSLRRHDGDSRNAHHDQISRIWQECHATYPGSSGHIQNRPSKDDHDAVCAAKEWYEQQELAE